MYTFLIFYSEFSCDASKKFSFCPFRDKKKKKRRLKLLSAHVIRH